MALQMFSKSYIMHYSPFHVNYCFHVCSVGLENDRNIHHGLCRGRTSVCNGELYVYKWIHPTENT